MHLLSQLDPVYLITTLGYIGIFLIILAESGIFIGFFLPGDSLLFTAGLLAATGHLNLPLLLIIVPIAAILGDSVGYWLGSFFGPRIFTREDSFFLNKKHIERSRDFYAKYGPRAIVLARFVPVVRTFIPILAGVAGMHYRTFLYYNIFGGCLWGGSMLLLGYGLGQAFPGVEQYLSLVIIAIVVLSFVPIALEHRARR